MKAKTIISHTCILLILYFSGRLFFTTNNILSGIVFFVALTIYACILMYLFLFLKPKQKRDNKIIPLSSLKPDETNTNGLEHKRAIIQQYLPAGNVDDNGIMVGKLFNFMVQIDDDNGSRWTTLIKDKFIPIAHIGSFGKFKEAMVCYNPENKYQAVFENEDWHHEVKK